MFRCKWFNTDPSKKKTITENNITSTNVSSEWYKDEPYILASQAKQVFYLDDLLRGRHWKIVEDVNHRQIWDIKDDEADADVDVVHDINSSNFVLTVDLGQLVMESHEPATYIGTIQNSPADQLDENFINDDLGEEEVDEEDELLVDICEDDVNHVSPIDVNLINDESDSDYSS